MQVEDRESHGVAGSGPVELDGNGLTPVEYAEMNFGGSDRFDPVDAVLTLTGSGF